MKAYGKPDDQKSYFRTNGIIKLLRFCNLMEPGRNVMSITKVYLVLNMFFFFFILLYLTFIDRSLLLPIMAQGTNTTLALMNYVYRRHVQNENGAFAVTVPGADEPVGPSAAEDAVKE